MSSNSNCLDEIPFHFHDLIKSILQTEVPDSHKESESLHDCLQMTYDSRKEEEFLEKIELKKIEKEKELFEKERIKHEIERRLIQQQIHNLEELKKQNQLLASQNVSQTIPPSNHLISKQNLQPHIQPILMTNSINPVSDMPSLSNPNQLSMLKNQPQQLPQSKQPQHFIITPISNLQPTPIMFPTPILQPSAVTKTPISTASDSLKVINFQDFEAESDPFDNLSLKVINDKEELDKVFFQVIPSCSNSDSSNSNQLFTSSTNNPTNQTSHIPTSSTFTTNLTSNNNFTTSCNLFFSQHNSTNNTHLNQQSNDTINNKCDNKNVFNNSFQLQPQLKMASFPQQPFQSAHSLLSSYSPSFYTSHQLQTSQLSHHPSNTTHHTTTNNNIHNVTYTTTRNITNNKTNNVRYTTTTTANNYINNTHTILQPNFLNNFNQQSLLNNHYMKKNVFNKQTNDNNNTSNTNFSSQNDPNKCNFIPKHFSPVNLPSCIKQTSLKASKSVSDLSKEGADNGTTWGNHFETNKNMPSSSSSSSPSNNYSSTEPIHPSFTSSIHPSSIHSKMMKMGFKEEDINKAFSYFGEDEKTVCDYLCNVSELLSKGYEEKVVDQVVRHKHHLPLNKLVDYLERFKVYHDMGFEASKIHSVLSLQHTNQHTILHLLTQT